MNTTNTTYSKLTPAQRKIWDKVGPGSRSHITKNFRKFKGNTENFKKWFRSYAS